MFSDRALSPAPSAALFQAVLSALHPENSAQRYPYLLGAASPSQTSSDFFGNQTDRK